MKWIGLTGGIASGKSLVAQYFRALGIPVVDADEVAKSVVKKDSPGLRSVVQRFGKEILDKNGELNREALGRKVFGKKQDLLDLEKIIHPLVQQEVLGQRRDLETKGYDLAVYDVPLLFEKNIPGFDAIIVVNSTLDLQKKRIRERNQWSDTEIEQRIQAQLPLSEKIKKADYVIENIASKEELKQKVVDLLAQIQNK